VIAVSKIWYESRESQDAKRYNESCCAKILLRQTDDTDFSALHDLHSYTSVGIIRLVEIGEGLVLREWTRAISKRRDCNG
jgi:hypothetical protein